MSWLHSIRAISYHFFLRLFPLFHGCTECPERFAALRQRIAVLPEPEFPVDIVYTWVDGADSAHSAKKKLYEKEYGQLASDGLDESRFRDNNELLYSLRSVHKYAPWVRRIFIVTDGQVPSWLNSEHPKVQIVDHREIIPEKYLPTFNSRVIEAFFQYIPGISEQYIFFNDDFFLSNACRKSDFFTTRGLPRVFVDWRQSRRRGYNRRSSSHTCSFFNTLESLKRGGLESGVEIITAHGPYPQRKSNTVAACDFYGNDLLQFFSNRFRSTNEITLSAHGIPLWALASRKAVPCDLAYYYINTKRLDRNIYYESMLREQPLGTLPLFYCLNDAGAGRADKEWRADMQCFLQRFYPVPSPFEKCHK